jgi:nitrogen fixation protein NifU and related proteins
MAKNTKLSDELKVLLEQWAEETLAGIGIFKNSSPAFEQLAEQSIRQLRSIYSDKAIDIFLRAIDKRKIESPDGFASVTGECGDTMEIFLKTDNGIITDASFQTDGCKPTIASGGMVSEMIKGRSINEIKKYTQKDVLNALGGLPEENHHCALLAIYTLKEAIEDYNEKLATHEK